MSYWKIASLFGLFVVIIVMSYWKIAHDTLMLSKMSILLHAGVTAVESDPQ